MTYGALTRWLLWEHTLIRSDGYSDKYLPIWRQRTLKGLPYGMPKLSGKIFAVASGLGTFTPPAQRATPAVAHSTPATSWIPIEAGEVSAADDITGASGGNGLRASFYR